MTSQRKALALLAILAAAGARGVSRDRLLALLWPESDAERARGALKQMVHALRRQLGASEAVLGVAELRLDTGIVSSDAGEFRGALAAGADEHAVSLYAGPFLDGVYLDGAPDFDRWVDEERARFAQLQRDALERLATRAERSGDADAAVRWWRARHAAEPLHARTSLRLMKALVVAGDREAAIAHARSHEAILRRELEVDPDPQVMALAASLRSLPANSTGQVTEVDRPSPPAPSPVLPPAPSAAPPAGQGWSRRRAGALLLVVATAAVVIAMVRRTERREVTTPLRSNRVAVAIFANRTGSRELDVLGTMASDWVTRGLAHTPGAEVFDVAGLFVQGRAPDGVPVEPRALARANGAGLVVAGNYYRTGDRLAFSTQVIDVRSGQVLRAIEPIEGDAHLPMVVVEEIRQRVAAALGTILDPRAASVISPEMVPPRFDAYAEFAAGQEIFWLGDWERALTHFRRAAALDSNFFSATAYIAVAGVGTGRCALVDSVRESLGRRRSRVPRADWLTVEITVARCGSDHESHNRLQRERLAYFPGSPMLQMTMSTGFRQLNRPGEALAILTGIDPARDLGWLPPRGRAFYWREMGAVEHLLRDYEGERSVAVRMGRGEASPLTTSYVRARALAALGFGDSALALLDAVASAPPDPALVSGISGRLDPAQLATPAWVMQQVALELAAHGDPERARGAMERAVRWTIGVSGAAPTSIPGALTLVRALDFLGRLDEARRVALQLIERDSTSVDVRGSYGIVAARAGDATAAREVDRWLARRPVLFPIGLPLLYRAQIAATLGDTAAALTHLRALPHGAHPLDVLHFHTDPAFAALRQSEVMRRWLVPRG